MLLPRFERFKPHTDTDLVYLKSSPDYCEFDVKRGSLGTHGRECDHVSRLNRHFIFCMEVFHFIWLRYFSLLWIFDFILFFGLQRSPGIDGCELMCCNRGYTTRREKRVERCKCKFHWCCFVQCEECVREVEVSVCK